MQSYRFYTLNASGRIVNMIDVDCFDDHAAMMLASEMIGPAAGAEVWSGDRLVGRVSAPGGNPKAL